MSDDDVDDEESECFMCGDPGEVSIDATVTIVQPIIVTAQLAHIKFGDVGTEYKVKLLACAACITEHSMKFMSDVALKNAPERGPPN